jgi:hypothetical protein
MKEEDYKLLLNEVVEQYTNTDRLTPRLIERICYAVQLPTPSGKKCSICNEPQFATPHGLVCSNGHGGADSL